MKLQQNISEMNLNQLKDLHRILKIDEQNFLFRMCTIKDVSKSQLAHHRKFIAHVEKLMNKKKGG